MAKSNNSFDPRKFMELAIEAMKNSINEPRNDGKTSPSVGVVLINPEGKVESAYRGQLRYGDHAEFTLLERINRGNNLTGSKLFTTLEPCAPGARNHPKLGCAERIVNARIAEVWVGIADPDPKVDRKGINFLKKHRIIVHMFDNDLQKKIREYNEEYLQQALDRADGIEQEKGKEFLTKFEDVVQTNEKEWYSKDAIELYIKRSQRRITSFSNEFWNHFESIGMVKKVKQQNIERLLPTGYGILLFGKDPRERFPNAAVKVKVAYGNQASSPDEFSQALVLIPDQIENWLKKSLHSKIGRNNFNRKEETIFPIEPLREAIINAIVHRDYEIKEAKTFIEINDDHIVIRSAGLPVDPISFDDFRQFRAPSLSRNPVITYVFNKMGFMEETELGMETFRNMNKLFNLPSPNVTYYPPYLSITFFRTFKAASNIIQYLRSLNEEELLGYEYLKSKGEVTTREYADHFGFNYKKAQRHLMLFKNLSLANLEGKGPTSKYVLLNIIP